MLTFIGKRRKRLGGLEGLQERGRGWRVWDKGL